ncbi:MAG: helix-turn-helix domain-containing protein [Oscillospiraceae bacterium]|nr:helix-turn-helix domain-containing protein [Oscillospiraceae bacterium]
MKFGETLQLLMEAHNMTPKQLAKVLRVSITMLNNYTHCILEPDFDTLKRAAAFFEVRTDDLLDYHGAPDRRSSPPRVD